MACRWVLTVHGQRTEVAAKIHMPPKSITRIDHPDPIAMAVAIDPQTATLTRRLNVDVETAGQLTRGQTVIDHLRLTNREPNADVVLEASRERFDDLLKLTLAAD
jgi:purine nucleosidase